MSQFPYIAPPRIEARLFYASEVQDRIKRQVDSAVQELSEGQSLLVEVPLGNGQNLVATYFGYQNPNFIIVNGLDSSGNEVTALVSHTNIQVIMTVLNKPAERKSIGFQRSSDS